MIRFRLGQRWKRERAKTPQDALGLEVDGLDLLGGKASEEPLAEVVPELVAAVHALCVGGEPLAQVSLPESHLELGLWRKNSDVELSIVRLERPATLARRVTLDLGELSDAAVKCGRALREDLQASAPGLLRTQALKQMQGALGEVEECSPSTLRRPFAQGGFGYRRFPVEAVAFGFELLDEEDRLLAVDHRMRGALPSLLCGGTVTLAVQREELWRVTGVPFLVALELSRQAADLAHALELGDKRFTFAPGGSGAEVEVRLAEGALKAGAKTVPVDPNALVRAMYGLGLELSFAASLHNKTQGKNPYLSELAARCREGLSHTRPTQEPKAGPPAVQRERAQPAAPLSRAGKVKRLRFEPLWERAELTDNAPAKLLLGRRGPIVAAEHLAHGFDGKGKTIFRREAAHGVAVSREGLAICAEAERVLGFRGADVSARWLRDHDGLPVGPVLLREQGLLITTSETRAAVAFDEVTGREIWRAAPPRTRRVDLSVQGHRALLATDSGYLLGLDLHDGQARYRVRAPLPFLGPTVAWGRRWAVVIGRKDRTAVVVGDAHSGAVDWNVEMPLELPSQPLAAGARLALAGERDGQGLVVCLDSKGRVAWEKRLHLGHGPYRLQAVGRAFLATSSTGAATLLEPDGEVRWHLGASGGPVARAPAAVAVRGVVVLPGEHVRAVDPKSGQVLAEVGADPGLCDLQVDGKLNLFLLDEHGTLQAYRLAAHFTVVGRP